MQQSVEDVMPLEREFDTYRRELPRLVREGHAVRWALIKEDAVISVWDTQRDVLQAGHERFALEPFAVKRIDPRDGIDLPVRSTGRPVHGDARSGS